MSENYPSIQQQSGSPYIFSSSANNIYSFVQCVWFSLRIEWRLLMTRKWSWWSVFYTINVMKVKYQCTNSQTEWNHIMIVM